MCCRSIGSRIVPSEPTRTVRVNSGASYTVIPTRSLFPIFSTGRLEPSLKDVAPVPARLGFACCCAETELATAMTKIEMVKHLINDSRIPAFCPSHVSCYSIPIALLRSHSMVAVSLERCDFHRKLLYRFAQIPNFSAKLIHVTPQPILSISTIQQHAHGIARKVRYASCAGNGTKPSESRVLLFGEPDAYHFGPRFQHCHILAPVSLKAPHRSADHRNCRIL